MDFQNIKNEKEYKEVLVRISEIFDATPGTPEGNELDRLITLVEEYEEDEIL